MTIDLAAGFFVATGQHRGKSVEQMFFCGSLDWRGNILQVDLRSPRGNLLRGVIPLSLHGCSGCEIRGFDLRADG